VLDFGVRLYGEGGRGSFARVTQGVMRALQVHGCFRGFVDARANLDEFGGDPPGGRDAPVAIVCGGPDTISLAHSQGSHDRIWFMLAANSEGFPQRLIDDLSDTNQFMTRPLIDGLLATSHWCAGVLRKSFPDKPVICMPHGVDPRVFYSEPEVREKLRAGYDAGGFGVLHVTSGASQRKGTRELLEAWAYLHQNEPAFAEGDKLLIVFVYPGAALLYERMAKDCGCVMQRGITRDQSGAAVMLIPGLGMDDSQVRASYSMVHVVCQPSRGEGFGLVPLEALACGVPVVATTCTGHSEHLVYRCYQNGVPRIGVCPVASGPNGPMDDYPGAMAPQVSRDDVRFALAHARDDWPRLENEARLESAVVREELTWEKQGAAAIQELRADWETHRGATP